MMNNTTEIAVLEATIRNAKAKIKALKQKSITVGSFVTLNESACEICERLDVHAYHEYGRDSGSPKKLKYKVVDKNRKECTIIGRNAYYEVVKATLPVDAVVLAAAPKKWVDCEDAVVIKNVTSPKMTVRKFVKGDTVYLIKDYLRFKHTVLIVNNDGTLLVEGRRKKHFLVNVGEIA